MGTRFITLVDPVKLNVSAYNRNLPFSQQPSSVTQDFLDAMEVREAVFVEEQGVPLNNEFDEDDKRSCHWIVYASVNAVVEPEVRDASGKIVKERRSSTRSQPIGTVRIVPFPHPPHPVPNGVYEAVDGDLVLVGIKDTDGETKPVPLTSPGVGDRVDRATTHHDGKEMYVKLGRLAVAKEFRGHKIARLLMTTALGWMRDHPNYFDPSVAAFGFEQLGIDNPKDIPKFGGLVCVHAQEQVVGAWAKMGFQIDEGMGRWWEEGIPHVGMFQRLKIGPPMPLPMA